jgi:hypothetical protein
MMIGVIRALRMRTSKLATTVMACNEAPLALYRIHEISIPHVSPA